MTLKIIGSGFSRTGTLSMKIALETLGFRPCYHAVEAMNNADHVKMFYERLVKGEPIDWRQLFSGYEATVDAPACIYYRELMHEFPHAKVIHTVRDPQQWYDSVAATIYQMPKMYPWHARMLSSETKVLVALMEQYWSILFEGQFADRRKAIEVFRKYNQAVAEEVPPHRLLVFSVAEGWEPLCKFLNLPVPPVPFPHANERSRMLRTMQAIRKHHSRATPYMLFVIALSVTFAVVVCVAIIAIFVR